MANETNNNLTAEQMAARIAELEGRTKGSSLSFKVSEKGAVSVYGLGRFPVTLYLEQWDALLSHASELVGPLWPIIQKLDTSSVQPRLLQVKSEIICEFDPAQPFAPAAI
jgi:hypothetical protein